MANNRFIRNIKIEADANGVAPATLQLLIVGSWNTPWHGDFEISAEDIDQFVANYKANIGLPADSEGKIQVNYGHASWDKAAGWMSNLRAEEDDGRLSLVADVEWTADALAAIKAGEWRYISPEFNPRALPWEDPEEEWRMIANVLTGAGLTNIPLFKKLKKVAASERPDSSNKSNQGEPMSLKLEDIRTLEASAITADQRKVLEDNKAELSTEELAKFDIKADQKPADPAPNNVEGDAAPVTINASELASLKAAAQQGVDASEKLAKKEASDFASARIAAGQVKSGDKETLENILLASSGESRKALEDFLTGLPVNASIGQELGDGGKALTASAHDELHTKVVEKIAADVEGGKTRPSYASVRASILASDADLRQRITEEEEK